MARRVRRSRADNERWNQMVTAVRQMNFAFNGIRLYPPTHSEVVLALEKLETTLNCILADQDDVGFGFMDELLYLEGSMSLEETAANQMLVDRFSRGRVKYLTIMKGVSRQDLLSFFQIINAEAAKPSTEHPAELLDQQGVRTIHITQAELDDTASKAKLTKSRTLLAWYEKAVRLLSDMQSEFRAGKAPEIKPLYRLVDDMMATIRSKGHEPYLLLPLLARDLDPHLTHAVNVGVLSCVLGQHCRLNIGQINSLCIAALLHDLGRIIIPPEWTQDHTPLSDEEKSIVRQHTDWGFMLLAAHGELPPQVALAACRHHDRSFQGKGYQPDIFEKIISLVDAYDLGLYGEKFYWKKRRKDRILARLLNQRGADHGPALVKLLINTVGYYPVGSLVRLDDGQRAIVIRPNSMNPARPKVYLFEAAPAAAQDAEEQPPMIADLEELEEGGAGFKRSIKAVLSPGEALDIPKFLDAKKEFLLSFAL